MNARRHRMDEAGSCCVQAIEAIDIFVAVVTEGYECSTWMGFELNRAWGRTRSDGKPRLFVIKERDDPLPGVFRRYEERAQRLPVELDEAVAVLLRADS